MNIIKNIKLQCEAIVLASKPVKRTAGFSIRVLIVFLPFLLGTASPWL